ncbi:MAG: ABC transporter ATP-binding protein [Ruthenibacterium sp.]
MAAAAALSVLSTAFSIVPYISVALLLRRALAGTLSVGWALGLTAAALAGYLLKEFLYAKSTLCSHKAAFEIIRNIRCKVMKKMARASMGTIQGKSSGEFKQLLIDDVERLEYPLAHAIPEITASLLVPAFVILYLLFIDWRMALSALASAVLGSLVYNGMMLGRGETMMEYMMANAQMNETIVEYVNGMEVIKAFNQTASSMGRFRAVVLKVRDITTKWYKHCWPFMSIGQALMPSTIAFTLPVGMALLSHGAIAASDIILCIILSLGIAGSMQKLMEFRENMAVLYEIQPQVQALLSMEELPAPETPKHCARFDVELHDVHFGYGENEILHGVSFKAPEGSMTAIVGPSGSGKTTITRLIARFWDVQNGSVKVGGHDVREFTCDSLLKNMSMVFQNVYLFHDTIENNIKFGCPEATHEQVVEAAKKACCHDFIAALPNGYDTVIGEGGSTLSGGERQRVSIARAMLKDAPIILLDEATASVDPENELHLQQAISALVRNKTLVVIAHRLSTIREADQILVVDNGRIVQQGTHEELAGQKGLYQSFWNIRQRVRQWRLER